MSKLTTLVSFALAAAVLCPGQLTAQPVTTPLGTYTKLVPPGSAIYSGLTFSPGQKFGIFFRDSSWQMFNVTSGKASVISNLGQNPAFFQVTDSGTAFFYATGTSGTGTYQLNLDGSIQPVIVDGKPTVLGNGQSVMVTYPGYPVVSRDGNNVAIQGIVNNNPTNFVYSPNNSPATVTSIATATGPKDPVFEPGAYSSESVMWGYWQELDKSNSYRLATMDYSGNLATLVSPPASVNGNTYLLSGGGVGTYETASCRHGVMLTAALSTTPNTGTDTPSFLLWYGNDNYSSHPNSLSVLQDSKIDSLVITEGSVLSMNSNCQGVFDAANTDAVLYAGAQPNSAVYRISPIDGTPLQMIAGTGNSPFPGEVNTIDSWPSISENGSITFVHCVNVVLGQIPNDCSIVLFTPSTPSIFPGGVVRSADGANQVTPGDWISIYGHGFNCSDQPYANAQFQSTGCLGQPSSLPVQVFVNGIGASLWYVSPGQINAQVPRTTAIGEATVQVVVGTLQSNSQTINLVQVSPAFFQYNGAAIATHQNGSLITATSPASVGEYINLWAAGLGPTIADPGDGQGYGTNPLAKTVNGVSLTIGGATTSPYFAGGAPNEVGLYQIVVQVPMPTPPPSPADQNSGVVFTESGSLQVAGETAPLTLPLVFGNPPPPE